MTIDGFMKHEIKSLTLEQKIQIIKERDVLVSTGALGESLLREIAERVRGDKSYIGITTCINWVYESVTRDLADQFIARNS